MKLSTFRRSHLAWAEMVNAWRIIPRIMIFAYMWLVWYLVEWYTSLEHYMIKGCLSGNISDCVGKAPSLEHAALITAIVGAAAAIFAFYTRTGKSFFVPDSETRDSKNIRNNKVNKDSGIDSDYSTGIDSSDDSSVFHNRPERYDDNY